MQSQCLFSKDKSLLNESKEDNDIKIEAKEDIENDEKKEEIQQETVDSTVLKPWRANMKRQKTIDESNEQIEPGEQVPSPKKDDKPWRANMKKSTEETLKEGAFCTPT